MSQKIKYQAIVIGISAGGMEFVKGLLTSLPGSFAIPIMIVQHIPDNFDNTWAQLMNDSCSLNVEEAKEKESIIPGSVYIAPANYHLLVEPDHSLTLSVEKRVNYARPSIDLLFESAAFAYGRTLIGIVGTGANYDGANGLLEIKRQGGLTIVQDPETAQNNAMPNAAIQATGPDQILSPDRIAKYLIDIDKNQSNPI